MKISRVSNICFFTSDNWISTCAIGLVHKNAQMKGNLDMYSKALRSNQ